MISLVSIAATILSLQNLSFVTAVLPPGYEDVMWCPEGYCRRAVNPGEGFAGPARAFNECYDPSTNTVVDEVWTGELSETVAPEGWIKDPVSCSRRWDDGILKPLSRMLQYHMLLVYAIIIYTLLRFRT